MLSANVQVFTFCGRELGARVFGPVQYGGYDGVKVYVDIFPIL